MNKFFAVFLTLSVQLGSAQAAPMYTVTDLGTLGSPFSIPLGINNIGQVVGYSTQAGNGAHERATLFSTVGAPTDLGSLGGAISIAMSINDGGQVVGYDFTSNGEPRATLFNSSSGSNSNLGTLGGSRSAALFINDQGQVVGEANAFGDAASRATLFNTAGGSNIDLGTLPGGNSSAAYGINNNGQIIGYSYLSDGVAMRATLFDTSGGSNIDLGKLAGSRSSAAYAINSSGLVVGESYTNYYTLYFPDSGPPWWSHATLFSTVGDAPIDLGTLGGVNSTAWDINDEGVVVGRAQLTTGEMRAFIWDGGLMTSLDALIAPDSGWILYDAKAINNLGQVAVWGGNSRGEAHALLLSPLNNNVVPEPATLLLLGIGFVGLGFTKISRKS